MKNFVIGAVISAALIIAAPALAGKECCATAAADHAATAATVVPADTGSIVPALTTEYLIIQRSLAADNLDGVPDAAAGMAVLARENLDARPAQLGVTASDPVAVRANLARVAAAADALATATEISAARSAFATLSQAMIPLRDETAGDRPNVAHCSMAGESWLQDGTTVANPYYGSQMLRCGEIVR